MSTIRFEKSVRKRRGPNIAPAGEESLVIFPIFKKVQAVYANMPVGDVQNTPILDGLSILPNVPLPSLQDVLRRLFPLRLVLSPSGQSNISSLSEM